MAIELSHKLIVSGPDDFKVEFDIPLGMSTAGRQAGNDLVLENPQVSRKHSQFINTKGECEVNDLGSSNGTYVNGEKLAANAPHILAPGDEIKVGPFTLQYVQIEMEVPDDSEPPKVVEPVKEPPPPAREPEDKPEPAQKENVLPQEKPARQRKPKSTPPPPPTTPPPAPSPDFPAPDEFMVPPGLGRHSTHLIKFLPGIFHYNPETGHNDFLSRFLALLESILIPIEWNVDNFDLFLGPGTSPPGFLPWLANWFGLTFGPDWTDKQRREMIQNAHLIFARRGTKWALNRVLEIYLEKTPEIVDQGADLDPHTFQVTLPVRKRDIDPELVEALIEAHKPAHTLYKIRYKR
jgi:phage tail-like protein